MQIHNPVIPGFHPDPSVCRVEDDYYLVTSSFEYFPGVPLFHSRNLVDWRQIGHCLTRDSQLDLRDAPPSGGIWAPTIRHHAGRFHMVTTNFSKGGNFLVHTDDPEGEWSDPVWIDIPGIDPSLYFEGDRCFFTANAGEERKHGLYLAEIDPETGEVLSPSRLIWEGSGGAYPEAPHLYQRPDGYYLIAAEGGTQNGHCITAARGKNIEGPYEPCPHNPIHTHRHRIDQPIMGAGHADFLEDGDGRWWAFMLAFRITSPFFHHLGRETFLAPMRWDDTGWPEINGGQLVGERIDAPERPEPANRAVPSDRSITDTFTGPELAPAWNFLRNPLRHNYEIHKGLRLRGSCDSIDDNRQPTLLCRRQQHHDVEVSTEIVFKPQPGQEAGLLVFYNALHYGALLLVNQGEGLRLALRRRVKSVIQTEDLGPAESGRFMFGIKAEATAYRFSIQEPDGPVRTVGTMETALLSTECVGLGFTGVFFGLYAHSSEPSDNRACFTRFQYNPNVPASHD